MRSIVHGTKKRSGSQVSQRQMRYLLAAAVALTIVAGLYLVMVSRTAAKGRHIQSLQKELLELEQENEQLEVRVASEGDVSRLVQRSIELEYAPARQVEYLQVTSE